MPERITIREATAYIANCDACEDASTLEISESMAHEWADNHDCPGAPS